MKENDPCNTALVKTMHLCSQREYCRSDIESKLENWNVPSSCFKKILTTLVRENFLNEDRYAKAFVKDKFLYNKWGKIKISAHLKAKKISAPAIRAALECIDNDLYISTLTTIINSQKRSVKAKNQYELKAKLLRFGQSRGFESNLLYDLLNGLE